MWLDQNRPARRNGPLDELARQRARVRLQQESIGIDTKGDEAAEAFREVLRLQPDHLDALSQLAYIHEEHDRLPQALELLQQAAKLDPSWYDLHFRMAKIAKALGQDQRAAEHYQRAERVKKAWAKPRNNPFTGRNPYVGDEPGALRNSSND